MRFIIPQFIEHEPKIVGPLTFKQFTFLGIAAAICFVLYFTVPRAIFFLICFVAGGASMALAFVKVDSIPLPTIMSHLFKYNVSSKMYLWKKGGVGQSSFKEKVVIKKEQIAEDQLPLKVEGSSRLKNIKMRIETKGN